jgi:hypothetical protein
MEEEKKESKLYEYVTSSIGLSNIEKVRQQLLSTSIKDIDIINSARLGTDDYDYSTAKLILEGGQAAVFEVKSKIDGKTYAVKRLEYQIDNYLSTSKK